MSIGVGLLGIGNEWINFLISLERAIGWCDPLNRKIVMIKIRNFLWMSANVCFGFFLKRWVDLSVHSSESWVVEWWTWRLVGSARCSSSLSQLSGRWGLSSPLLWVGWSGCGGSNEVQLSFINAGPVLRHRFKLWHQGDFLVSLFLGTPVTARLTLVI